MMQIHFFYQKKLDFLKTKHLRITLKMPANY
jgi:hypothetical protein